MKVGFAVLVLTAAVGFSAHGQMQGEYLVTDYGAKGDNAFDNAPIINGLIAKFGASGGTIIIPPGDFRVNAPIVVSNNYVTIRGVNDGQRSNVDPTPPGVFGPAGGSKIILGAKVPYGIVVSNSGPVLSGLTIKDLNISGSDGSLFQVGISIQRSNQWARIDDVSCINLGQAVYILQANDAHIESCWMAECAAPLHMDTGNNCTVANNSFGGQPPGVTCDFMPRTGSCSPATSSTPMVTPVCG